jgi:hypothetical protein
VNLDAKGRKLIEFNPNLIFPWFLMASYLYYHKNLSLFSDEYYDELSKELLSSWDQVEHRHKHLILKGHLIAGSLYTLKEEDYPEMCKAGALFIARELGE